MGKTSYALIGAMIGVAATVALNYFFGPAKGTTFDQDYRSRFDYALEEGQRAATTREAELRRQLEEYRRLPSQQNGKTKS